MKVPGTILTVITAAALIAATPVASAAPRKVHTVALGAARKVPYSKVGDPAGAAPVEDSLKIRALLLDSVVKEWTTGDAHDVTDRSFVVRRVIRLNDALPSDKPGSADKQSHWVWQRGPWLLVDRVTCHIVALKLPDYDNGVSQVSWFRDYGAYCGVTSTGKSLFAVVAQVARANRCWPKSSKLLTQPAILSLFAPRRNGSASLSASPFNSPERMP